MAKDISKVFINISGRTMKNVKSFEWTPSEDAKLDEPDIYGNAEIIEQPNNSAEATISITKNTDDEAWLTGLSVTKVHTPFGYRDAAGKREYAAAATECRVLRAPRTNDRDTNQVSFKLLVTGIGNITY